MILSDNRKTMDEQFLSEVKAKMLRVLEMTRNDLGTVRTGRVTPALVEHVEIFAYGSQKMQLRELATITTSDVITIVIHPFDPSTKEDIVKSIQNANIGLNPVIDSEVIRITIPPLSQERRQEYIKLAKAKLEAGRIMVRQVRHEFMNDVRKSFEDKEINEDDKKGLEETIQKFTDEMIAEIDLLGEMKEKELMQV